MPNPRYLEKFESRDASIVYELPLLSYEYQPRQGVVAPISEAIGMDYGLDRLGFARSLLQPADETVRFVLDGDTVGDFDDAVDELKSKVYLGAQGKIWTLGADGSRRWAWARVIDLPQVTIATGRDRYSPAVIRWRRVSAWRAEALTTVTATINTAFQVVNVTNPGNIPVDQLVIRMRANAAGGFTNPHLHNVQNGYSIGTLRDSVSVNSEVRIDTGALKLQWSDNDGASYVGDWANRVLGDGQKLFLVYSPGLNEIEVTTGGSPDWELSTSFYAQWA